MHDATAAPRLFRFRFDPALAPFAFVAGITPSTARLSVGLERLDCRFGPWHVVTDLDNVAEVSITGPYRPWKVMGPPHLSLADGGLTFASSTNRGVCLRFRDPVPGIEPVGLIRHPGLTMTVDDVEGLVGLLRERRPDLTAPADDARPDFAGHTAKELRALAREQGVEGASSMTKAQLLDVLTAQSA